MDKELKITTGTKAEKYDALVPQIKALVYSVDDQIANMANIAAALKSTFDFFWVGFYRKIDDQLILGPFQGPVACTHIQKGKGVCGTAWEKEKTIIVENVDEFPGHIACNALSKSEIVLPIYKNDVFVGVLDVDSDAINDFDEIDQKYLEQIISFL